MSAHEGIQNLTEVQGYEAMTDVGMRTMASQDFAEAQAQLVSRYPVFMGISKALGDLQLAPTSEAGANAEPQKTLIWLGFVLGASALMLAIETAEQE